MAPIATELSRAFRLGDIAEKDRAYKALVDKAVSGLKKDDVIAIIEHSEDGCLSVLYTCNSSINTISGEQGRS